MSEDSPAGNGQIKVAKFGGSSLADAEHFRKVADIIRKDSGRRFVVASAPGKRNSKDVKVTDLLYSCYESAAAGREYREVLHSIRERFEEIAGELAIDTDMETEFTRIERHLSENPQREFMASRGEYLNAKLLAAYLGFDFVDAAGTVCFSRSGQFNEEATNRALGRALAASDHAVIPGFYGASADGRVHTFSRGGSDVTGSLAARAVNASVYENWTDVSGMLFTDPRIVQDPQPIEYITYKELRELSYMGASVLHENAVFPVRKAGIPINIRNTNRPEDEGTWIVAELPAGRRARTVTGIAGNKGFTSIQVEKSMMNAEVGFGARLLEIFARCGVPFEHCPTGIDTMSVIVNTEHFEQAAQAILGAIRTELKPDTLLVEKGLAMIAVVGHGMKDSRGCAARIFRTVADAGINIRMIDQGSSELNVILGVDEADYEEAVRSIYREFR